MKGEVNQLNKIAVSTPSHLASFLCWYSNSQYSHCSSSSSVVSSVSRYVDIFDHLNDIHSRVHVVVVDGWMMMIFHLFIVMFRIRLRSFFCSSLQRADLTLYNKKCGAYVGFEIWREDAWLSAGNALEPLNHETSNFVRHGRCILFRNRTSSAFICNDRFHCI